MKNYKVVFAIDYKVEARDESEATEKAQQILEDELRHMKLNEVFGAMVDVVNEELGEE